MIFETDFGDIKLYNVEFDYREAEISYEMYMIRPIHNSDNAEYLIEKKYIEDMEWISEKLPVIFYSV